MTELGDAAAATRSVIALGYIFRLLTLDDLWTAYLERAHDPELIDEPDFEGLDQLAGEMSEALGQVREAAASVRTTLETLDDGELDGRVMDLFWKADEGTASGLAEIFSEDLGGDSARDVLIAACKLVEEETDDELAHLSRKRAKLDDGALPDPDLRPRFRCLTTLAGIGALWTLAAAGAVTVVGAPVAIGAGLVGAAANLVQRWKKSGCKKLLKELKQVHAT